MNVRKTGPKKPRYPTTRQFLAALGVGALAASAQAQVIRLGGKPGAEPVKPIVAPEAESPRLLGDIAVEPVLALPGRMPIATNTPPAAATNVPPASATNTVSYTVKQGDTLTSIARTQFGDAARVKDIKALNPGLNPDLLAVGAVILLPGAPAEPPRLKGAIRRTR